MRKIFVASLFVLSLFPTESFANRMEACRRERSCFMALNGVERGLCEAYVEGRSCFISLMRCLV